MMEYDESKLYKIVYNDNNVIKSPRGTILNTDNNYVYMRFKDGATIAINHKDITTISEVRDNDK